MSKPITNLLITGITTCKQMRKLAKLTNTELNASVKDGTWRNDCGMVTYSYGRYLDYIKTPNYRAVTLTWEEFLAEYDKPKDCCKKLKKLKKENKRLKKSQKKPWTTDQLKDKDLVRCWDKSVTHRRTLVFYDTVNKRTFSFKGTRKGYTWDNYAPFKGKEPKWAKKLENH